jgi:hypothetical protein
MTLRFNPVVFWRTYARRHRMTRTKSLTFLGLLVLLAIAASGSAPPINAALPPTSASPEGRIALRPFDDAEPEPISSPLTSTVYLPLIMQEMYVYLPMVLTTSPLQQPLPADGQRDVSANTYLGWQFSDARAAGATFTIYFEIDDPTPDTVLATGLTTSVYALPTTLALGGALFLANRRQTRRWHDSNWGQSGSSRQRRLV